MINDEWAEFLLWEAASRDTIDFKKIYVDMAGDLVAGLMLSQIVYWYLPSSKDGRSKLRVCKDSYYWIAKARAAWWDEIRISVSQADRALTILEDKGIIVTHIYKFSGAPTKHIRINKDKFLGLWMEALVKFGQSVSILAKGENPFSPNTQMNLGESAESITETTAETSTENTLLPNNDEISGFDEDGAPLDTPKPKKYYIPSCEYEHEDGTTEVIEDDSWRQDKTQIDFQILNSAGLEEYPTKKDWKKARRVEKKLEQGTISKRYLENRCYCAENLPWGLDRLLNSLLNASHYRNWQEREAKRKKS